MPSVKTKRAQQTIKSNKPAAEEFKSTSKRRPATEDLATQVELDLDKVAVIEVNAKPVESVSVQEKESITSMNQAQSEAEFLDTAIHSEDKLSLNFPGDQWVKKGFPKAFDVTETIVNEWVYNGNFETLPIQNPFIRYAAKTGLKKAKQVETQVLESPVTEKVITKLFEVGFKAQATIDDIREKLKTKA